MKIKTAAAKETKKEEAVVVAPTHYVPVEHLLDHPDLPKQKLDADWVAELKGSIEESGLDTPLQVWNGGDTTNTMELKDKSEVAACFLIAGFHRRAAIRQIAKESPKTYAALFPNGVPIVMQSYEDVAEVIAARLRENLARRTPTTAELLPLMQELRDKHKKKQKEIAAMIGRSEPYVAEVFSIEENLGAEGAKEVAEGGVHAKDALKAAKAVKAEKKAGKTPDVKKHIAVAKAKTAARVASGRDRDEKRTSGKRIWKAYKSLPSMTMGAKVIILEGALEYISGETDKLPKELRKAVDAPSKTEKEEEKKK